MVSQMYNAFQVNYNFMARSPETNNDGASIESIDEALHKLRETDNDLCLETDRLFSTNNPIEPDREIEAVNARMRAVINSHPKSIDGYNIKAESGYYGQAFLVSKDGKDLFRWVRRDSVYMSDGTSIFMGIEKDDEIKIVKIDRLRVKGVDEQGTRVIDGEAFERFRLARQANDGRRFEIAQTEAERVAMQSSFAFKARKLIGLQANLPQVPTREEVPLPPEPEEATIPHDVLLEKLLTVDAALERVRKILRNFAPLTRA